MLNKQANINESVENSFNVLPDHLIQINRKWFCQLIGNLERSSQPQNILLAVNVLKDIITWNDYGEKSLQDSSVSAINAQVKCLCLDSLKSKWPILVNRFATLIRTNPSSCQKCIISFLELWKTIVSVKTSLSIYHTKPFNRFMDAYVILLSNSMPSIISLHIVDLFSEMLCYGNTLALQQDLAVESRSLAQTILENVEQKNLLHIVPYIDENKIFLQKLTLLVLKAVAVTVKGDMCDTFSDSDGEENDDSTLVRSNIYNVFKKLDIFMKKCEDYYPTMKPAEWIVRLFAEHDDYLIESMLCCLDVARASCYRFNSVPEMRDDLNPSISFLHFLNLTFFNADVLVNLLKSNRTCFLLYFMNFLKYARDHWSEFAFTCRYQIDSIISLFISLRQSLENQISNNEFPYNIDPVLALLRDCCERH